MWYGGTVSAAETLRYKKTATTAEKSAAIADQRVIRFVTAGMDHLPPIRTSRPQRLFPVSAIGNSLKYVVDGDETYQAFLAGGTSVRSHDPDVINAFIDDMERIKGIEGIDVQINNHPFIDDLFARQQLLDDREEGESHPFVSREGFLAFVDYRISVAKDQLLVIMED